MKRSTATLRFAKVEDFAAAEEVYREWFPTELSVDDSVYADLLSRGGHMRILELSGSAAPTKVVGFYTFWPLTLATYEHMKTGRILERNFNSADIAHFDDAAAAVLYIPEIGVSKSTRFGRLLVKDALDYACDLLRQHANLKLVSAWGYSAVGISIVVRLGMMRTPGSTEDEAFYEMSADAARNRCTHKAFQQTRQITVKGGS